MKSKYMKLILAVSIVIGLAACEKSSFQLREGESNKITNTDDVQTTECTTDCEEITEVIEEPTVQPPVVIEQPPVHPPVDFNDPYACHWEKELFGSVAHISHSSKSQEILWNYFEARGPNDYQVKYYQIAVMNEAMTVFKSEYQGLQQTSYLVEPWSKDIDGQNLEQKLGNFYHGQWHWYQLIALDANYKVVHTRKFDVSFSTYHKDFNRVVGFCSGY